MAEGLEQEDRTEEPTARRLQRAREDGEAPRSTEVPAAAVTIAVLGYLVLAGSQMFDGLRGLFSSALTIDRRVLESEWLMAALFGGSLRDALLIVSPVFLVTVVAATLGAGVTGGYVFSTKLVAPNLDRLDPLSGLKRVFGIRALVEAGKNVLKAGLVLALLYVVVSGRLLTIIGAGSMSLEPAVALVGHEIAMAGFLTAGALVLTAVLDAFYQRHAFAKKMRMTKQEIKDELKDMEGRPEIKAQIRRRQREIASARMIERVKDADVVITNPQHFSVALAYDPSSEGAPVMLAKGADAIALRMREEAARHGVHVFEAPPLARALFFTTKPGQTIPESLYFAAAQVIAYVFHLNSFEPGRDRLSRPIVDVPSDMRFNGDGRLEEADIQ